MAEAGIGVDIVEISRMKSILEKTPSFARRVFTEEERAYCDASFPVNQLRGIASIKYTTPAGALSN